MKGLSAKQFEQKLRDLDACSEAVTWVKGKTSNAAWKRCERADWMLWLLARVDVDRKIIVCIVCDCAEMALQYVPAGEDRPRLAIEMARKWTKGEVSLDEVRSAANAAANAAAHADATADDNADYKDHPNENDPDDDEK
jgi:hypothetical protein